MFVPGFNVIMVMSVVMSMRMLVFMIAMVMVVITSSIVLYVDIELGSRDVRALLTRRVQVVSTDAKLFQLVFQLVKIHAYIQQRTDEHVTADAAEDIEIQRFHC